MATTSIKGSRSKMSNNTLGVGVVANLNFRGDVDDSNLEAAAKADAESMN